MENLSKSDLDFIKESLEYTKRKFENHEYHSREFQLQRISEAQGVLLKINKLIIQASEK